MARILVVEDSPDIRFLIRMLLEGAGHEVISVGDGRAGVIGVRFKPVGAFAYLGRPLSQATDRRLALDPALATGLAALSEPERLARVEGHVATRLTNLPDAEAVAAVAALQAGAAVTASRALQRRFAREVGVSPRMLAAVFRFRRVFDALEAGEAASWTQAAQAAGYFDHPQLVRDFRRFLGCTPSQYMRTRGALAAGVASIQDGDRPA